MTIVSFVKKRDEDKIYELCINVNVNHIANSLCTSLMCYSYPDHRTMRKISKLPYVIEVNRLGGPYDIIVKLYSDNEFNRRVYRNLNAILSEWLLPSIAVTMTLTNQGKF